MTHQLEPIYAIDPVIYCDHSKSGGLGAGGAFDVYVPKLTDDLKTNDDCLTFVYGGSLAVAPAEGWRVTQLRLMNTDTSNAIVVTLWLATAWNALKFLGAISVPANAGTNGLIAATNGLSSGIFPDLPRDAVGNPYIDIQNGSTLVLTAATAAKIKSMVTIAKYTAVP